MNKSVCVLLSIFSLIATVSSAGFAQTKATSPPSELLDFDSALDYLAKQGKMTLIAEGVPFKPRQKPEDLPAELPTLSFRERVNTVASLYDYDAIWHRKHITFRKRFTDPRDLPDVCLAELKNSQNALKTLAEQLNPKLQPTLDRSVGGSLVMELVKTLTPEQRQIFEEQSEIDNTGLSAQQKALVYKMCQLVKLQLPCEDIQE